MLNRTPRRAAERSEVDHGATFRRLLPHDRSVTSAEVPRPLSATPNRPRVVDLRLLGMTALWERLAGRPSEHSERLERI